MTTVPATIDPGYAAPAPWYCPQCGEPCPEGGIHPACKAAFARSAADDVPDPPGEFPSYCYERLDGAGQPLGTALPDLAAILRAAKARGGSVQGICLLQHGKRYLAACMDNDGICDPRNWEHQATPEAALADLARRL